MAQQQQAGLSCPECSATFKSREEMERHGQQHKRRQTPGRTGSEP